MLTRTALAVVKRTSAGQFCWYLKSAGNHTVYVSPAFKRKSDCKSDREAFLHAAKTAVCQTDGEAE